LGLGLIFWFARDDSSEFVRGVLIATGIGDTVGLVVVVMGDHGRYDELDGMGCRFNLPLRGGGVWLLHDGAIAPAIVALKTSAVAPSAARLSYSAVRRLTAVISALSGRADLPDDVHSAALEVVRPLLIPDSFTLVVPSNQFQTALSIVRRKEKVDRCRVRLACPQTIIGGGLRQLPTGTQLTANQEALRARYYSRCSMAYRAFDPL